VPNYDDPSGLVRYDSSYFYDGFVPPYNIKPMAQIKLNLFGLTIAEIIQLGKNVHTALTGNGNVSTPNPTLIQLETLNTNAEDANDAYEAGKDTVAALKAARDTAVVALMNGLRTEAHTVEVQTGGDPAKIITTGFSIKSSGSPVGLPTQVLDLKVTASDMDGTLKASWKKVRGASSYQIQTSPDPIATWTPKISVTKTRAEVNSLTSGDRIWVRVRAVGTSGEGPWSDPAVKTVP
jgi:hypothetical protein